MGSAVWCLMDGNLHLIYFKGNTFYDAVGNLISLL